MGDAFAPWHIIILLVVFVLLFGARKLPDSARSLGQAMRIFKSETKGLHTDEDSHKEALPAQPATTAFPAPAQQAAQPPAPSAAQPPLNRTRPSSRSQDLQRQIQELQHQPAADGRP